MTNTFTQHRFGDDHYVPVLKAKLGELSALEGLTPAVRSHMTPLIAIEPQRMSTFVEKSAKKLGPEPFFLQPQAINRDPADPDWLDEGQLLYRQLAASKAQPIPTVWLSDPRATLRRVAVVVDELGCDAALRIDAAASVSRASTSFGFDVLDAATILAGDVGRCHLLIDVGGVRTSAADMERVALRLLSMIPAVDDWLTVSTLFSAFPDTVSTFPKATVTTLPRLDADAWQSVVGVWGGRVPTFGDYAIGTPTFSNIPFAPIPSIKYTILGGWQIHRGSSKADPSSQYRSLAQMVESASYFSGGGYSAGDRFIVDAANHVGGPGNATSWVRAATNHHLSHVVDRLQSVGAP